MSKSTYYYAGDYTKPEVDWSYESFGWPLSLGNRNVFNSDQSVELIKNSANFSNLTNQSWSPSYVDRSSLPSGTTFGVKNNQGTALLVCGGHAGFFNSLGVSVTPDGTGKLSSTQTRYILVPNLRATSDGRAPSSDAEVMSNVMIPVPVGLGDSPKVIGSDSKGTKIVEVPISAFKNTTGKTLYVHAFLLENGFKVHPQTKDAFVDTTCPVRWSYESFNLESRCQMKSKPNLIGVEFNSDLASGHGYDVSFGFEDMDDISMYDDLPDLNSDRDYNDIILYQVRMTWND